MYILFLVCLPADQNILKQVVKQVVFKALYGIDNPSIRLRRFHCDPVNMQQQIEVERKFLIPEDFENILQALPAVQTHQISFQDNYFDTFHFSLVLQNYWLRKRDTCWELKYPLLNPCSSSANATTQYHEATTAEEILQKLADVLQVSTSVAGDVQEFVDMNKLETFACYQTHRKSYKYQDLIIDIDDTDFGYSVGEVEMVVESSDQVEKAVKRIEDFADEIGVTMKERIPSKMSEYLMKHNRNLYDLTESKLWLSQNKT